MRRASPTLAVPGLSAPRDALVAALTGRIRDHHRFLIGQHLATIEQIEATIAQFDARLEAALGPFRCAVERLTDIPGIGRKAAEIIIAEIGVDMTQFPSADHLVSWAGLCPRLDESAGKRFAQRESARGRRGSSQSLCRRRWRRAARKTRVSKAAI